ncbi:MAG: MarR family transcriptional regulator [Planctomycetes bacterium]|nr:MarR family transcriptional regulator [Planctomycetota bacterium]
MTTGHEIAMGLRAAYLAMHRRTNGCLAERDVTADQFVLLSVLAREDGITQQELVRRSSSDPNTIRAMLVLLEKRKLVARADHPTDGRARCVTMTRRGRRTYERLVADTEPLREQLVGLFRPKEADALVESLARISRAMERSSKGERR